jgi:hypothetical protein
MKLLLLLLNVCLAISVQDLIKLNSEEIKKMKDTKTPFTTKECIMTYVYRLCGTLKKWNEGFYYGANCQSSSYRASHPSIVPNCKRWAARAQYWKDSQPNWNQGCASMVNAKWFTK